MSAASSTIYLVLRNGDLADRLDRQRLKRQRPVGDFAETTGSVGDDRQRLGSNSRSNGKADNRLSSTAQDAFHVENSGIVLNLAQPLVGGMAEIAIIRPAAKLDFSDQRWLHEDEAFALQGNDR